MSFEEFQNYYETTHVKLIKYIQGVQKYTRRYLHPIESLYPDMMSQLEEQEYDAITEVCFNNRKDLDIAIQNFLKPELSQLISEDEEKFPDRKKTRMFFVDEYDSNPDGF